MNPAERAREIMKDARFKQARKFLKEKNYEDSIDIFATLVQSCNETYGEMSVEAAAAWYEYGHALLLKEEDNPSNDLLGNVQGEPNQPPPEDEDVGDDDGPDEEAGTDGEHGEGGEDPDEVEGDLQIAWEALDVARAILAKQEDAATSILLSDVYMRLGDLSKYNNNSAGAIGEYESALAIRSVICKPYETALSDVQFSLALAHVDNAAEDGVDALAEKRKALDYYQKARQSIVQWIEVHNEATQLQERNDRGDATDASESGTSSSSSSSSAAASNGVTGEDEVKRLLEDKKELVDVLQETIDALKADIIETEKGNGTSSSSSAAMGVTTIGFGQPSSSSGHTTVGFGGTSSSAFSSATTVGFGGSASAGVVVNEISTVQVKRKRVAEDAAGPDATKK